MKSISLFFVSLLIVSLVIVFDGCSLFSEGHIPTKTELNTMVVSAINGDSTNNALLGNLFPTKPGESIPTNAIRVDSITLNNKPFYVVLIEAVNPLFTRLALYDSSFTPVFIDKSLNGNISLNVSAIDEVPCLVVEEKFVAKGLIRLSRRSYYALSKDTTTLLFRGFTDLFSPKNRISLKDSIVSKNEMLFIVAENTLIPELGTTVRAPFESGKNYYVNSQIIDSTVQAYINTFESNETTAILDSVTAKLYINEPGKIGVTTKQPFQTDSYEDLFLYIPKDWVRRENVAMINHIRKSIVGKEFTSLDQNFSIIIAATRGFEKAEHYTEYPLLEPYKNFSNIRMSEVIESDNSIFVFYELMCKGKRYIIQTRAIKGKSTVEQHLFEYILESAIVGC